MGQEESLSELKATWSITDITKRNRKVKITDILQSQYLHAAVVQFFVEWQQSSNCHTVHDIN